MSDSDDFSGTRPYGCSACGTRMRTRGIDGRCIACHEAPAVRCTVCARVRFDPAEPWGNHPGTLPREVPGVCRTCGDIAAQERAKQYARECRRTAQRAAKGYGAPAEGVDIFDGFKGAK